MNTAARTPVYLDYAATTPVDERVAASMMRFLTAAGLYANPASTHGPGAEARSHVEQARASVAGLIGARAHDIVWTSGATESDNLALKGAARLHAARGRHIVTARTEHKAVLDTCKALEREGFRVSYLLPGSDGIIDPAALETAVRDDTVLVSVMHVNNEIGVVQDIAAIGAICRARGVTFHVDAAQSAGKIALDVNACQADLMSFSAHKVYGPKGIGALYVRGGAGLDLEPLIHGGGHERGLRSGTLATHQIVGMGEAFRIAGEELLAERQRLAALRARLWQRLEAIGGIAINGHPTQTVPGILNVCVSGVEGESLQLACRAITVSSGAACMSASGEGSYVLRALGRPDHLAQSSMRLSLGRQTKVAEVDFAAEVLAREIGRLRAISVH